VADRNRSAAVTDSDAVNAVVGHIAHSIYHIQYVVVRNNDPAWRPFQEAFGVQIVSSEGWGVQRIEELMYPTATPIVFSGQWRSRDLRMCNARCRGRLPSARHTACTGCSSCLGDPIRIGAVTFPEMVLEGGDVLHVSATLEGIEALRTRLNKKMEA